NSEMRTLKKLSLKINLTLKNMGQIEGWKLTRQIYASLLSLNQYSYHFPVDDVLKFVQECESSDDANENWEEYVKEKEKGGSTSSSSEETEHRRQSYVERKKGKHHDSKPNNDIDLKADTVDKAEKSEKAEKAEKREKRAVSVDSLGISSDISAHLSELTISKPHRVKSEMTIPHKTNQHYQTSSSVKAMQSKEKMKGRRTDSEKQADYDAEIIGSKYPSVTTRKGLKMIEDDGSQTVRNTQSDQHLGMGYNLVADAMNLGAFVTSPSAIVPSFKRSMRYGSHGHYKKKSKHQKPSQCSILGTSSPYTTTSSSSSLPPLSYSFSKALSCHPIYRILSQHGTFSPLPISTRDAHVSQFVRDVGTKRGNYLFEGSLSKTSEMREYRKFMKRALGSSSCRYSYGCKPSKGVEAERFNQFRKSRPSNYGFIREISQKF
ncbi:hypothetical protein ADUPG1_007114, partial [Aduncisulcus paluster]